ncbi:MAG: tetratricopeptide repeat protein [Acidobacteriota bacterium]
MAKLRLVLEALEGSRPAVRRFSLILTLVSALSLPALAFGAEEQSKPSEETPLQQAISLAVAARYEEALEIFEELLKDTPEDPLLRYYIGLTNLRLERLELATIFLKAALDKKAPFPEAYYWLASLYLQQEKDADALEVTLTGLQLFPRNKDLLLLHRRLSP